MRILKFTKKDEKRSASEVARPEDVRIPISDEELPINRYYLNVSRVFNLAEYIFIVITLLFGLTCVISDPEIISYRNFLMLVSDINAAEFDYNEYTTLTYSTEIPEKSVTFDGGIAVPGEDSIFVYTETGRLSYTRVHGFSEPCLAGDGKYAVLYDFGTVNYKIYNSYTELYSGQTEYPIYGCTVNKNGDCTFIEVTPSGRSRVSLYNSDFSEIGYVETSGFAVAAASNGDKILAVLTLSTEGGSNRSRLTIHSLSTGTSLKEYTFEDVYPIGCRFVSPTKVVAILNTKTVFAGSEDMYYTEVTHASPKMFDHTENRIALLHDGALTVIDLDGNIILSEKLSGRCSSVSITEEAVFVLGADTITRYRFSDGSVLAKPTDGDSVKIIASSENHLIAFGRSGASMIDY